MNLNFKEIPSFGVAGNFTDHLEQAGEAIDFIGIKTAEENAPKAIFPTYIPVVKELGLVPPFLHIFPFDPEKIIYPAGEEKIQMESECAVVCRLEWNGDRITRLVPFLFGASNDCSIRKEGAKKISLKKNWGKSSKGLSNHLLDIDEFSARGNISRYRITSFLLRGKDVFQYGEDSAIRDYSYIFEKLVDWMMMKLNDQKDEGPAEDIGLYLRACGHPENIMISIGATRYTDYGKSNFLNQGDESLVLLYPEDKYTKEEIEKMAAERDFSAQDISALCQKVVCL
ncbi:MAG: hypothetical protein J6S91_01315 [Treponema sp.]|nr:hypothetical protein [Treponema sp.]